MLKKIGLALAALVAALAIFVATRPAHYTVSRQVSIDAPASVVYAQLADFRRWEVWSPWEKLDPSMQKVYSGAPGVEGQSYAWRGNDKVGEGRMTLVSARPTKALALRLEFIEPFAGESATAFQIEDRGAAAQVTWTMDGDNDFLGKLFCVFMDMDKIIGGDFERGLASLRTVSMAEAARSPSAQATAQ